MTLRPRAAAASKSSGGEPCAEKITVEPSGISPRSSTVIAPLPLKVADYMGVMYDLVLDVDGRAQSFEREHDDVHCPFRHRRRSPADSSDTLSSQRHTSTRLEFYHRAPSIKGNRYRPAGKARRAPRGGGGHDRRRCILRPFVKHGDGGHETG